MQVDPIRFFVPGRPAPGGSKRAFTHRHTGKIVLVDMGKGNAAWKRCVAKAAAQVFPEPLAGPLAFTFTFILSRPRCHYGTGRNHATLKAKAPDYPIGPPDTTKLIRAAEDGMKGLAWKDDSQVVAQHAYKVYGAIPGVWVEVSPFSDSTSKGVES